MTNHWEKLTYPHIGWNLINVIDVLDGKKNTNQSQYGNCNMCGREQIRYVHIIKHVLIDNELRVGCICAGKMTDDFHNPRIKENALKKKSSRRKNWGKKNWKVSLKGNLYLKISNHCITIFTDKYNGKYKVRIDETIGKQFFNDIEAAKIAAFNGIEYFKERGEW